MASIDNSITINTNVVARLSSLSNNIYIYIYHKLFTQRRPTAHIDPSNNKKSNVLTAKRTKYYHKCTNKIIIYT